MNIERDLKRIAGVLACWSFTSLVVTGQLTWFTTVLIYALYGLVFWKRRLCERIKPHIWRIGNLLAIAAAVACARLDLGYTLVYGTAYLQLQQMIRARTVRDYSWLFAVSFFQLVLAGAVSSDLSFLIIVVIYLGLGVVAITLLTFKRGQAEVESTAHRLGGLGTPLFRSAGQEKRPLSVAAGHLVILPRPFFLWTAGTCLAVALLSVFFFIIIPRLAVRKTFMSLRAFDSPAVTGFSDQVYADGPASIQKDRTMVMWVWMEKTGDLLPSSPPPALRLRGVALDAFNGSRWFPGPWARTQAEMHMLNWSQRHFRVPFAYQIPPQSIRLVIEQDMHQTKWLFAPPFLSHIEVEGRAQVVFNPELHSIHAVNFSSERFRYHVHSYIEPTPAYITARVAAAAHLQTVSGDDALSDEWIMPEKMKKLYTLLPENMFDRKRLQALADQITLGAQTPYEKALRILRFFNESFTYSLTPEPAPSGSYVSHFLLRSRAGHCELMASGMAILCRLADLPARVVNGFYSTEYNSYQQFFYVRQNHSHTWVEVWLDGFGWLTFDPTPPSALLSEDVRLPLLSYLIEWWDSWTVLWRRYVVDYTLADQSRFFWRMRDLWETRYPHRGQDPLARWFNVQRWQRSARETSGERGYTWHGLSLAGLVAAWVIYRRQRRNGRLPSRQRRKAVPCRVAFYAQILAALARHGWRRRPDQTPAAFARAVLETRPDWSELAAVTDTYYRVRYGGDSLRPLEREKIESLLFRLRR